MSLQIGLNSKVQIKKPVGYMQGLYKDQIGEVINIKEDGYYLVLFTDNIKLSLLKANLKLV